MTHDKTLKVLKMYKHSKSVLVLKIKASHWSFDLGVRPYFGGTVICKPHLYSLHAVRVPFLTLRRLISLTQGTLHYRLAKLS